MIAKKDFRIITTKIKRNIKKGDDVSKFDLPQAYLDGLVTEGVIDAPKKEKKTNQQTNKNKE